MASQSGSGWNSNPYKMAGMLGTDVAKLVLGKFLGPQCLPTFGNEEHVRILGRFTNYFSIYSYKHISFPISNIIYFL